MGGSGQFGKLLVEKCWYLERNFGIWREILPFCIQNYVNCGKFGSLIAGK